jgi:hypothetical protein
LVLVGGGNKVVTESGLSDKLGGEEECWF